MEVLIVDKAQSAYHPEIVQLADVRDRDALAQSVPYGSVIINLAAEHKDNVRPQSLYREVNVLGASNICSVAAEKGVRTIVFTSSVAVYGFAPVGTNESGVISPFNEYGRSKHEAEQVFRAWQAELPLVRSLVILRPTVVFGERNRGNVYNLFSQIWSRRFAMIGNGQNRKSMVYVENVAAFIEFSARFPAGVHVHNIVDKPDFTMNRLVSIVNRRLGRGGKTGLRLPYSIGYLIGKAFDGLSILTGRTFAISSIRVKKFCSDSMFGTSLGGTGFVPPVSLEKAIESTIKYEFLESHEKEEVFYTE